MVDPDEKLTERALAALRAAYDRFSFDLHEPVRSRRPFAFVASYPRSGNTLVINAFERYGGTHAFVSAGGLVWFTKRFYPHDYPYRRVVKDHYLRKEYDSDRTVALVRDGRDTMISLAYMTRAFGLHAWHQREDVADFIRFTQSKYEVGSWANFAAQLTRRRAQPHCLIEKYEDLLASSETLIRIFEFAFDGEPIDRDRIANLHAASDDTIVGL